MHKKIKLSQSLCASIIPFLLYQAPVASAGFEDVCEPNFALNDNSYQSCNNLPVLIPSNDNHTNMYLLLSDLGLAEIKAPVSNANSLWESYDGTVPFDSTGLADLVKNKIPNQRKSLNDDLSFDERCASIELGKNDFEQHVKANNKISAEEKKSLISERNKISKCNENIALISINPAWSSTARQYGSYLNASIAFYNGNYSIATKIYSVLATAEDVWVKEAAQYMMIRSTLNSTFATGLGEYGDIDLKKINQTALKEYLEHITSYLKLYPNGQYAASARGLMRRGFWLANRKDLLVNELVWQINNPKSKLYNLEMKAVPQEIDRRIFDGKTVNSKIFNHAFFLATYDLMQMRSSSTEGYKAITWNQLNEQKESFKKQPELFQYLQAVHLFHIQKKPQEALNYLPKDLSASNNYLQLSQAFLKGEIIEKTAQQNAQAYWDQLYSKSKNSYQRSLFEAMLAKHLNKTQDVDAFIGKSAKISQMYLQRDFITLSAHENSLQKIIQSNNSTLDQKQLAIFTLLIKLLNHQNFAFFNQTYPLMPTDAIQYKGYDSTEKFKNKPPFSNFVWNGSTITPQLKCPDLKNLSIQLANTPKDPLLNVCLGEYMRSDKAYTYGFLENDSKTVQATSFARGNTYKQIIKNGSKGDLQAYALYRAIQCYAPGGNNDCGDNDVEKSVRKQWYDRIKSEYPETTWAKSLKYYW